MGVLAAVIIESYGADDSALAQLSITGTGSMAAVPVTSIRFFDRVLPRIRIIIGDRETPVILESRELTPFLSCARARERFEKLCRGEQSGTPASSWPAGVNKQLIEMS